ncbi:hypothetical protein K7X08_030782 [Anisodus acutangulus]|uniref:Uncharacterized protein n=1 Tax=Anisodus acutangulus TaxID=402998 RepID=A0A9Q1R971_9SOLA|nr:hypothetical protein K7X08_030782 [Anisodus acutangulus]
MSAKSCLAVVIRAPLKKLWISIISSVIFGLCMQQINFSVSMRLRPKRTCSGVVCFGGFHMNRFLHPILLLRIP